MSAGEHRARFLVSGAATVVLLAGLELFDARASRSSDDHVADEGTARRFGVAMSIALLASVGTLASRGRRPLVPRPRRWWFGLSLIWTGAVINRSARRHLGRNYRSMLTIVPDHDVVATGPYRVVRHPMYAGSMLILAGCALAVDHPLASASWILPAWTLVQRIEIEESLLAARLGADYEDFRRSRPRLVPVVW